MARPAKFSHPEILDAALTVVAQRRHETTIKDVAQQIGAPVGSIYHRFSSREELLGTLWIREIERFHVGLLQAAALEDPHEGLLASARHIPAYCRDHPDSGVALTLFRAPRLAEHGPDELRERARHLNDDVDAALRRMLRRRLGSVSRHRFQVASMAVRQTPYGMVRPFLGREVPRWLDEACVRAAAGVLELLEK